MIITLKAVGKALKNTHIGFDTHIGFGTVATTGLSLWSATSTYQDSREAGHGRIISAASAVSDLVLPFAMGGWTYAGYELLKEAPGAIVSGIDAADKYRRKLARENSTAAFANAKFNDTEMAYTMRQAGMAAAQRSKYNTQVAMLGNEAKYMYR